MIKKVKPIILLVLTVSCLISCADIGSVFNSYNPFSQSEKTASTEDYTDLRSIPAPEADPYQETESSDDNSSYTGEVVESTAENVPESDTSSKAETDSQETNQGFSQQSNESETEPGTERQTEPPTEPATEHQTEPPTEPKTEPPTEPVTEPPKQTVPVWTPDSTFDIYFLDVGQGDAACILCDGKAMLIDGGSSSKSDLIYSFLKAHKISHLDYIVATHPDADHIGGLAGALNYATVGTAFCTTTEYDSKPFQSFKKYLKAQNASITIPNPGDTFYLGCSKITILFPDSGKTWSDNTSIALRIEFGNTSFLFMGDCETADEKALLAKGFNLKSDVIKIAHHGSKYSTSDDLLQSVKPRYAVLSVGGSNSYGHPTEEVLSKLKQSGIAMLLRTDIHGDIHCISNGSKVTFYVEKNSSVDAYIAPGGYKNYLDELAALEAAKQQETKPPVEESTTADGGNQTVTYIGNSNTHKFHKPSCSSVKKMKESNKVYFTGGRDEPISQGYDPCKNCNP